MCGITGIYAKNLAGKFHMINLSQATDLLEKRGPDARGVWMNDFVGLGHRRLSIIDTSYQANQPMQDSAGRYRIVYNGEIYNYKELRKDLLDKGYSFNTESDTEVLLCSFIHYKEKCLEKLNGFFAFAIYDQQTNDVFMARDRFGIKPLYYYEDDDKLLFASDMHSILAFGIEKEIDSTALHGYLQLNYVPSPLTMIKGVKMLDPGHFLKVESSNVTIESYYRLSYDSGKAKKKCSQL